MNIEVSEDSDAQHRTSNDEFKNKRGYKLFSGLNILDSRLRGSDSDVGFVIPAEAGIQYLLFCNHDKKNRIT